MNKKSKHIFSLLLLLLITGILSICGCTGSKTGPLFVSNEIVSLGWRFNGLTDNIPGPDPETCVLIGLPLWHDWNAKINGVAFAPLYLGVDQVNGAALACVGFTHDVNGVQIGILGAAGNINGVIIAPFSFVGRGDCMQISLIAHNGIGQGSGRVLGQIALWNNVDSSSGVAPIMQIGVVNSTSCRSSGSSMTFQIGVVNCEAMTSDCKSNKKLQFGLVNVYNAEDGKKQPDAKIIQIGLLNFRNGSFCPISYW